MIFPSNPISVLAYFEVLLNKYKISMGDRPSLSAEMDATLVSISRISSEKGQEVQACMRARHEYYVKGDEATATAIINDAIEFFKGSPYPLLAKMELGTSMRSVDMINEAIVLFDSRRFDEQGATERKKAELFRIALAGQVVRAIGMVDRELRYINPIARERFKQRLGSL